MTESARVDSIDALRALRTALWKFAETATVALGDAESEMQRTLVWLEMEQHTYWQGQIRKRQEMLGKAQEALRMKRLFKDSSGRTPSAVEEEKAVILAKRRLEEAEQKLVAVRTWARRLQKEIQIYKGSVQRFATSIESDIPTAAARLDRLVGSLEAYMAYTAPTPEGAAGEGSAAGQAGSIESAESMARQPEAPSAEISESKDLRGKTPSDEARVAASENAVAQANEVSWKAGLIPPAQQEAASAWCREPAADPSQKITLAAGARTSPRIYLERVRPASNDDAGWHVGAAEGEQEAIEAMRITDLLRLRPDFGKLLGLPQGFLVTIDEHGMAAVFDDQDHNLWSAASQPGAGQPGDRPGA